MSDFDLLGFRRKILENNIILLFEGKMSQGVLVALVEMLKEKLSAANDAAEDRMEYTVRKLYTILVELAQNIQNHSLEKEIVGKTSIGIGIVVMREGEDFFTVSSGNLITSHNAEELMRYCHYLNGLDKDDLKKLYKEKLKMARRDGQRGAGIGLIEIMRKSDSLLEAAMQPVDEHSVFFNLSINLAKGASHE